MDREYFKFTTLTAALPPSVDLRKTTCFPYLPPKDQGSEGSCVSYAMGSAVECAQRRNRVPLDKAVQPKVDAYYQQAFASAVAADSSAKTATNIFGTAQKRKTEDGITFAEAVAVYKNMGAQCYWLVPTTNNLKQALYAGYPFIFGFAVTKHMRQWQESKTMQRQTNFVLPDYIPGTDTIDGYHSALAVGYDDRKSAFLIRNSWGPDWGDNGHFWMRYKTLTHPDVTQDAMVVDVK